MAICAADMRSCDKKARCVFGPNEGQAYNPGDPCCGQGVFNSNTCDCDTGYGVYEVEVKLLTTELAKNPEQGYFMYSYLEVRPPFFDGDGRVVAEALGLSLFAREIPGAVGELCDKCDLGERVTESTYCKEDITSSYACLLDPDTGLPNCKTANFNQDGQLTSTSPAFSIWNIPKGTYYRKLCGPVCEPDPGTGVIPDYSLPLSPGLNTTDSLAIPILRFNYYPETTVSQNGEDQSVRATTYGLTRVGATPADDASCRGILGGYYSVDYKFIGEGTIEDNYGSDSRWNERSSFITTEKLVPLDE